MISTAIWISSDEAKVFRFESEKTEFNHLKGTKTETLFGRVAGELKGHAPDRLVLLGPGTAKKHFRTYLEKHLPLHAKHIVALEATARLSDREIEDVAHRLFTRADAFEAI